MNPEQFQDMLYYFAHARDRYEQTGDLQAAQSCEDAIATAHRIETERHIHAHYSNQIPKAKKTRRIVCHGHQAGHDDM